MVLGGAGELLEAFSRIPEGPVRESVIGHAQALASAYSGDVAQPAAIDPLRAFAAKQVSPVLAPPAPVPPMERKVRTESPEGRTIELRMGGMQPYEISETLGIGPNEVLKHLRTARRNGIKFQPLENPKAGTKVFHLSLETVTGQALSQMQGAAAQRGISLETYMERRRVTIEMAQAGASADDICEAVKETRTVIGGWCSQARAAGITVPYWRLDGPPAAFERPPPAKPTYWRFASDLSHPGKLRAVEKSAAARGITVAAMGKLRRDVLADSQRGMGASAIMAKYGLDKDTVRNWRYQARRAGLLEESKR